MVNSPREIQPLAGKDKQPRPSGETMVKYCIHCGKANDDQAVFCIACGQRFPDQTPPPSVQQAVPAPAPSSQATNVFTAEIGPGAHEHMLTDVHLKDSTGKVLLVARKKSLLHAEYTVVDGDEGVIGFIEQKEQLGTGHALMAGREQLTPLGGGEDGALSPPTAPNTPQPEHTW